MAYNDVISALSPDFWWDLDGDLTDKADSANSDGGSVAGYVSSIIPALSGSQQAADFNGSSNEVDIPNNSLINSATTYYKAISLWFYADTVDSTKRILWGEGGSQNGLTIHYDSSYLYFNVYEGSTRDTLYGTAPSTGTLYHVFAIMNCVTGEMYLYVNGSLEDSKTGGLNISTSFSSHSAGVAIGGADSTLDNETGGSMSGVCDGRIQDVAYWGQSPLPDGDDAADIYAAGLGSLDVTGGTITSGSSLSAPTVELLAGTQEVTSGFRAAAAILFAATLSYTQAVTGGTVASGATLYAPPTVSACSSLSLVTKAKTQGSGYATTSNVDTTGADFLIAVIADYDPPDPGTYWSDSKSNSWTWLTSRGSGNFYVKIGYCANPTVGTGHNWTYGANYHAFFVYAFSGMDGWKYDTDAGDAGSSSARSTPAITPDVPCCLLVTGFGGSTGSGDSCTVDGGFVLEDQTAYNTGVNPGGGVAFENLNPADVSVSCYWTDISSDNALAIASFKPPLYVTAGTIASTAALYVPTVSAAAAPQAVTAGTVAAGSSLSGPWVKHLVKPTFYDAVLGCAIFGPTGGSVVRSLHSAGDILLFFVDAPAGSSILPPPGWTLEDQQGTVRSQFLYWRIAGADEPTIQTWYTSSGLAYGLMVTVQGPRNSDPVTATAWNEASSGSTIALGSLTPDTDDSLRADGVFGLDPGDSWSDHESMTERVDNSGRCVSTEQLATGGATGTRTHTRGGSANGVGGIAAILDSWEWTENLDVVAGKVLPTSALYAPTVAPQAVSVTAGTVSSTAATYPATVSVGAAAVTGGTIAPASVLYPPTADPQSVGVTAGTVAATAALYAPTVSPQAVAVTGGTITSGVALYPPSLGATQSVTSGTVASALGLWGGLFVGHPVSWINQHNVTCIGPTITKTGGTDGAYDAWAETSKLIDTEGFFEAYKSDLLARYFFGLTSGGWNQTWQGFDFAFYTYAGALYVYEFGSSKGSVGSAGLGDRLTIELKGGTVRYYQNGTLIYTSLNSPGSLFRGATLLYYSDDSFDGWIGGALIDPQSVTGGTVASGLALYPPTISTGALVVTGQHVASTAALYPATVAAGAVAVTTGTVAAGSTLYAPSVTTTTLVSGAFLPSGLTPYPPTLSAVVAVTGAHVPSGAALYAPSLESGAVGITTAFLSSSFVSYAPSVSAGGLAITAGHIGPTAALYAPSVSVGAISVTGSHIASGLALYPPVISTGALAVVGGHVAATLALHPATVGPGAVALTGSHIPTSAALYAPSVAVGAASITAGTIGSSAALYPPTVAAEGGIVTTFLASTAVLHEPTISTGAVAVTAGTIGSSVALYAPLVAPDQGVTGPTIQYGWNEPILPREGSNALKTATTSLTLAKPTGVVSGDLLIAIVHSDSFTQTGPSGWSYSVGAASNMRLWYKVAGGSEPSSYTWTFGAVNGVGSIAAFKNIGSPPIIQTAISAGSNYLAFNVTTDTPGSVLWVGWWHQNGWLFNTAFTDLAYAAGPPGNDAMNALYRHLRSFGWMYTTFDTFQTGVQMTGIMAELKPANPWGGWLYSPVLEVGSVEVGGAHIASTTSLYAPGVAPAAVAVSANHISSTAALYAPTLGQAVESATIGSTLALYAPSVQATTDVSGATIASTAALYGPTVSGGIVYTPRPGKVVLDPSRTRASLDASTMTAVLDESETRASVDASATRASLDGSRTRGSLDP